MPILTYAALGFQTLVRHLSNNRDVCLGMKQSPTGWLNFSSVAMVAALPGWWCRVWREAVWQAGTRGCWSRWWWGYRVRWGPTRWTSGYWWVEPHPPCLCPSWTWDRQSTSLNGIIIHVAKWLNMWYIYIDADTAKKAFPHNMAKADIECTYYNFCYKILYVMYVCMFYVCVCVCVCM